MIKKQEIKFSLNGNIYIMAPAGTATGGPEGLHQLAYALKKNLNLNIMMYYVPKNVDNPVHGNYKEYSIDYTKNIEDESSNLLIIPESFEYLNLAKDFKKIKKIIWWLSIDNYLGTRFHYKNPKLLRSLIKIPYRIIYLFNKLTNNFFGIYTIQDYIKFLYKWSNISKHKEVSQSDLNLMQSNYAFNYLNNKLPNIDLLIDYQKDIFFRHLDFDKTKKENLICYYPYKSNAFMKKIVQNNSKFKFVSLVSLSTDEIIEVLKKTKIYIDFGYHPGKDRLPRESVLLGNCIITNKKGSAYNNEDIPILDEFKFNETYLNLKKINHKIISIFENYEEEYKKFLLYYNKICAEKETFNTQVKNIFKTK